MLPSPGRSLQVCTAVEDERSRKQIADGRAVGGGISDRSGAFVPCDLPCTV